MPSGKLIIKSLARCPEHPGREAFVRGVCKSCYDKLLRAENPEYAARQRENVRKWVRENRARNNAINLAWTKKQGPLYGRARKLSKYGLTIDDYDRMFAAQSGACNICRKPPKQGKSLHVDHCHDTGRIRGLLCFRCNFGLSFFFDDADTVARALTHLRGA